MVAGYRDELIEILRRDWPPERVHTLVIWTKVPPALASDDTLSRFLTRYDQIFLHLTVTGLGGSVLEPHAPPWTESIAALPRLVDLARGPERVRLRFDPLMEVETARGGVISNLDLLDEVVGAGARHGVKDVSTSWVTLYRKVSSRLRARGMSVVDRDADGMKAVWDRVYAQAASLGVNLHACCVPGQARSRCVDGELLSALHPRGLACSTKRAADQRPLCGCTESFDVGWYKSCPTGCLYCYGNPAVPPKG
jgi:DNA repair photolyase